VTVSSEGTIAFPPLGDVTAGGLTAKQLGDRIGERLSTYLRESSTVTVTVTRYMSRSVHVIGAVSVPGRYGFAEIPNLLDAINAAGGAVPGADLARVQLIRKSGPKPGTTVVDLARAQREGTTASLPPLAAGDMIVLQSLTQAPAPGEGFAVLGDVARPGIYPASGATTIWLALAQGGGLTSTGDLSNIKLVQIRSDGQQVTSINLKDVLKRGGRTPPMVQGGDVVYVPTRTSSIAAKGWVALTQTLALTADFVNIVIIADYLDSR
jgi:polysaccharide export outer membrane protein